MSATISAGQSELVNELLAIGKWRNKSEIYRHALELVKKELESERLAPLSQDTLTACYAEMNASELADDAAMSRASAQPSKGELE